MMVKRLLGNSIMNASADSQQGALHGCRLLKVISLAVGLGLLASSAGIWWGLLTNAQPHLVADFLPLYAGGWLLWQDRTHLYDLERQLAVETSILAPYGLPEGALAHNYQVIPYNYPPFFTLPLVPLAWLSFPLAYATASVLNLLCLAVTLRLLIQRLALGSEQTRWLLLVAFCAAAIYVTLIQGQTSLLALLLLTLYVLDLQERRGVWAGIWAGLLLFKPQLLPLPLLILAWRRCWRGLLALLVVLASLILVSLALVGVQGLQQHVLLIRQMASAEGTLGIHPWAMHNLRALARFSLPRPWDSVGWWGSSALLALITLWVHRPSSGDGQSSAWRWSATIVALLLFTPHLNTHDLALLLLPCALVLSTYNGPTPIPMVAAWVGLSALPLLTSALGTVTQVYWPIMPVALMAAFLFCLRQGSGNCRQSERLLSISR
jgi:Glycosyltransferase family 87